MTKGRVGVALSGGMDSSVAALLLKEAGYEVMGVHARLWNSPSSEQQEQQAQNICRILNIPFHTVDLRKQFDLCVVDYFSQEYKRGRTPNPCIACNQQIKFGLLLSQALSLGANFLATGHYARIEHSEDGYHLLKAADLSKDQSYFLYTLTQEKLKHLLFPLGSYTRTEVKQIAKRAGLSIAFKPSQDICFVAEKNYRTFLSQRFLGTPGDMVDGQGKVLGRHQGMAFYTIGQRHGLGLASGKLLYVIRIEAEHNRIVLSEARDLYSGKITATKLNWVAGKPLLGPITAAAKIRYISRAAEATLFPARHCDPERSEGEAISDIWFPQPQWAVAPGQAIVFYKGDEVLGGGVIESAQPMTLGIEGREYVATAKP